METRIFNAQVQLRSTSDMVVGGYAARYNIASKPIATRNGDSFQEILKPTAFRDVLSDPHLDCVCLVNHDANKILGRTTSRTLRLRSDNMGLEFECDLPNTSYGRDLYESVKRGDMNGCSFAFQVDEDEWADGAYPTRTIHSVKALRDVSIVTDPAYPHTEVGLRSEEVDLAEVRSRIARAKDPTRWRKHPTWRSACEHQGIDPDTASLRGLIVAIEQGQQKDRIVVARRRAIINDLIL